MAHKNGLEAKMVKTEKNAPVSTGYPVEAAEEA